MMFHKHALTRAAALGLLLLCAGPLSAQLSPNADDAPVIDLDAVLDAPEGQRATGGLPAAPAVTIAPVTDPVAPEIPEGAFVTVPSFERGVDPDAPATAREGEVLLPLTSENPTLDGIVRLSGEVQSEKFFIDLPQAAAIERVVLSYRVSINVLPEQSEMLIRVNGVATPAIRPDAFDGFEQIFLPAALFVDGRNEIVVSLRHTHRIFCGPSATFDVWTEINTNTSGVRIDRGDLPIDAVGMAMALSAQVALSGNLPVRLIDDLVVDNPEDVNRRNDEVLNLLSPRLAGLRGSSPIILAPEDAYGVTRGTAPLARITVLHGIQPSVDIRRGGDGTAVLLLTMGYDGELPELDTVLPFPEPLENNALLVPDAATPLRDLGFQQMDAYNHYTEQNVTFRLPDDWLLLASQTALLRLDYTFLDGLPTGALMLVKINNTTVRMLPLDINGGNAQPTLDVGFRARLLRPGANLLTFATIVPGDPVDQPCAQMPAPIVTIDNGSTLFVPSSPKMQMSDLARPMMAMQPDQITADFPPSTNRSVAYFPAILAAALRPIAGVEPLPKASLHVTLEATDADLNLSDLGINRRDLLRLFDVGPITPDVDADTQADLGLFARAVVYAKEIGRKLRALAVPDDGPLPLWLQGKHADAALFVPRDAAPEEVWLMVRPQSSPQALAAVLAQARLSPVGPRGRLSILNSDGTWESWRNSEPRPWMLEPLTIQNFRTVAGNFASWSPLYYGALLMVLTFASVGLALVYVMTTRGGRKG
jgi:hypothetical protein